MSPRLRLPALRHRDGHHARVTYEELFFDLVYVFAVTQLSHHLLHHLDMAGVLQALVLWFAVWLGWQYACWVSNWFDPQAPRIRGLLFATMLLALLMSSSIPEAFADRAWMFAGAYATMQVGRTAFVLFEVGGNHPLAPNFRRMLAWVSVSACFWLAGAAAEGNLRLALWAVAVACEYISPMFGFAFPRMGRSRTRDWTIEGGHLAERCQLFVIVALGETLLATGGVLSEVEHWSLQVVSAVLATFAGTIAMWWLYFGISSRDATEAITHAEDPGRMGANFHYVHALLIAGIIATAVGNDLVMDHPAAAVTPVYATVMVAGPLIYLLGSALYKRVVYGHAPRSHLLGAAALLVLCPLLPWMHLLAAGWLTSLVLLGVGLLDTRLKRRTRQVQG
ncbi:low temperature requirement protein A [Stenotrophomonas maltophilia]|uniref:low temperature requirement protein A n=1 Tax=Stenotrophomonas maltophilia TaxID=40324 RepID=UPI0021C87DCF|nr:low temperature requirement protein A [Stenotrophomonas maltophilia]MCU1067926.1 low temperature requirement protein A [Stenotrophomonas maltophilia]MCU1074789.1 low temperature requirement protein A [Stenotrophomonas maltophilia]MCU1139916.1 low temperature requirement protein A [Stenotrophomonas maltophilia]